MIVILSDQFQTLKLLQSNSKEKPNTQPYRISPFRCPSPSSKVAVSFALLLGSFGSQLLKLRADRLIAGEIVFWSPLGSDSSRVEITANACSASCRSRSFNQRLFLCLLPQCLLVCLGGFVLQLAEGVLVDNRVQDFDCLDCTKT